MQKTTPVILLGFQRSGTTALAYIFSEIFAENDGVFTVNGKLPYYLNRWLQLEDLQYRHFRADEILYSLKRKLPGGTGVDLWLENVEKTLRKYAEEVADGKYIDSLKLAKKIIEESYSSFSIWGDKYNEYLHTLSYLQKVIPGARYIILYRNPYEIAASIKEWRGDRPWRPTTLEKHVEKWLAWHKEIIYMLNNFSDKRYLIIEYDNLCLGKETQRISDFLGIDIKEKINKLQKKRSVKYLKEFSTEVNETWNTLQSFRYEKCNN